MVAQAHETDSLLEAARTTGDADYNDYLALNRSREAVLTFSKVRENALAWYPFAPDARILELRCGPGFCTGRLLRARPSYLAALTYLHQDAAICEERFRASDALSVMVVTDEQLAPTVERLARDESFDYVVLHDLRPGDGELLCALRRALIPSGRVLVTAANSLSYRELASPRLERTSLEDAPLRSQVLDLLHETGFANIRLWYAYPDQAMVRQLFTDNRPPEAGELSRYPDPEAAARLSVYDEELLVRSFAREGSFGQVAGGFVAEAAIDAEAPLSPVRYTKVSHERQAKFALATTIEQGPDGPFVRKRALYPEGATHLASIPTWCAALGEQMEGTFIPNRARLAEDGSVELEYLSGVTLEDLISDAIAMHDDEEFHRLLAEYQTRLEACATTSFVASDEVKEVFGSQNLPGEIDALEGLPAFPVTDIDLIFRNIIVGSDGAWNLIDYEWTFDLALPVLFVQWRALRYLLESETVRARETELKLWETWGLNQQLRDTFFGMEMSFQWYVHGRDPVPIDELLQSDAPPRLNPTDLLEPATERHPSLVRRVANKLLRQLP